MKWGDSFKVETPTFDPESGIKLEFRGLVTDCLEPFNMFYLIKYPGILLGKIRVPVETV
jgi:hypothetical protein